MSVWTISALVVKVRGIFCVCLFVFSPSYVVLWDSKTPHRPEDERVSWCLETSPSWLPPWNGSLSLIRLSLFLSFIFCPTSSQREWAVFLGACCPLPAFRSCFVEFAQHSNDLLMNLWGKKWSPHPIFPPSWIAPPLPYLNPACTSRSSRFRNCWSLTWRILSIIFLACEMNALV